MLLDAAGSGATRLLYPSICSFPPVNTCARFSSFLFHDKSLVTDDLVDLAYRQHLERGDGYTIHNLLQHLPDGREWLDKNIAALKLPTLIVWGEQDAMMPVATAHNFQRLISGSQLEVIAECGHLPALEKPAELVRLVLSFLD